MVVTWRPGASRATECPEIILLEYLESEWNKGVTDLWRIKLCWFIQKLDSWVSSGKEERRFSTLWLISFRHFWLSWIFLGLVGQTICSRLWIWKIKCPKILAGLSYYNFCNVLHIWECPGRPYYGVYRLWLLKLLHRTKCSSLIIIVDRLYVRMLSSAHAAYGRTTPASTTSAENWDWLLCNGL